MVKYANSVLSYVGKVQGLKDEIRDAYKGRAYFHRAYAYYNLTLQFGDIPLITKLLTVPKQNYKSTSKTAIFQMLQKDLEFAVAHVPAQAQMTYVGQVNQEACMQLLIKVYLVNGEYAKAEKLATDLINDHGLHLMTQTFGTWQPSGCETTWKVTRNVVWDLHRTPNICNPENKETIMAIINSNDEDHLNYNVMRAMFAHWSNGVIKDPHGLGGPGQCIARNNKDYNDTLDWTRAIGRGIALNRTSYFYNKTIWYQDGETDWQDLRHNREVGNWVEMEDLKYNNKNSPYLWQALSALCYRRLREGWKGYCKEGRHSAVIPSAAGILLLSISSIFWMLPTRTTWAPTSSMVLLVRDVMVNTTCSDWLIPICSVLRLSSIRAM